MSRSALGRRRSADWELQQTASKGLDESRRSASVEATFAGLRFALGLGRPDDEKADDKADDRPCNVRRGQSRKSWKPGGRRALARRRPDEPHPPRRGPPAVWDRRRQVQRDSGLRALVDSARRLGGTSAEQRVAPLVGNTPSGSPSSRVVVVWPGDANGSAPVIGPERDDRPTR